MDAVLNFFAKLMTGPWYIIYVIVLIILIFACIGYLSERSLYLKAQQEKYAKAKVDPVSAIPTPAGKTVASSSPITPTSQVISPQATVPPVAENITSPAMISSIVTPASNPVPTVSSVSPVQEPVVNTPPVPEAPIIQPVSQEVTPSVEAPVVSPSVTSIPEITPIVPEPTSTDGNQPLPDGVIPSALPSITETPTLVDPPKEEGKPVEVAVPEIVIPQEVSSPVDLPKQ